ncbi:unnamed protein product [Microthlaspi erraticum]|uniref:Reverse transcriptase domain-containing protein n=1 Tax=Microthlaspi erraticum TaxID=1685480 RepID=A0A6D2K080_9BRAS|nr:unnamed protein product [Microthlaspi erraticum]
MVSYVVQTLLFLIWRTLIFRRPVDSSHVRTMIVPPRTILLYLHFCSIVLDPVLIQVFVVISVLDPTSFSSNPRISPELCMHRIILEDESSSSIEHQRRLNPNLKEVVKKEIMKLLKTGVIYPISYSAWVSPVHVLPKK